MKQRLVSGWVLAVVGAFVLGLTCGAFLASTSVNAAQTFGPKDVKSVPKAFLEGGDRNVALLSEILKVINQNTDIMNKIEGHAQTISANSTTVLTKVEAINRLLSERE